MHALNLTYKYSKFLKCRHIDVDLKIKIIAQINQTLLNLIKFKENSFIDSF